MKRLRYVIEHDPLDISEMEPGDERRAWEAWLVRDVYADDVVLRATTKREAQAWIRSRPDRYLAEEEAREIGR